MNMNSDEIFKELKRDYQTILDVVNREIDKNKHKILKIFINKRSLQFRLRRRRLLMYQEINIEQLLKHGLIKENFQKGLPFILS